MMKQGKLKAWMWVVGNVFCFREITFTIPLKDYDGTEMSPIWKCDWNALKSLFFKVYNEMDFSFSDAWIIFSFVLFCLKKNANPFLLPDFAFIYLKSWDTKNLIFLTRQFNCCKTHVLLSLNEISPLLSQKLISSVSAVLQFFFIFIIPFIPTNFTWCKKNNRLLCFFLSWCALTLLSAIHKRLYGCCHCTAVEPR